MIFKISATEGWTVKADEAVQDFAKDDVIIVAHVNMKKMIERTAKQMGKEVNVQVGNTN